MGAGFRSWQPQCPSGWPNSSSLLASFLSPLPPCWEAGGEALRALCPSDVSLFLSQPSTTLSNYYLQLKEFFIYTVSQTVYHAELTLDFFKCAIKKKSGHLYLQEHNSWGHDVNERRYPKIISKGPRNGIFLVQGLCTLEEESIMKQNQTKNLITS